MLQPPSSDAPERHLRLVGRLRVRNVGGVDVRRAPRQSEEAGKLAADRSVAFTASGVPKAGAPALHVDVRREGAVDDRRARPDELRERDPDQRLGMLLHERAEDGDRRHGARQRERRDDAELPGAGEIDDPLRHRDVELQRRGRVDDRVAAGRRRERLVAQPACDAEHREAIGHLRAAAAEDERHLVASA